MRTMTPRQTSRSPARVSARGLQMTVDQAEDVMMREAKTLGNGADNFPITMILLKGLRETFPCER
jgi:hypothetical protein